MPTWKRLNEIPQPTLHSYGWNKHLPCVLPHSVCSPTGAREEVATIQSSAQMAKNTQRTEDHRCWVSHQKAYQSKNCVSSTPYQSWFQLHEIHSHRPTSHWCAVRAPARTLALLWHCTWHTRHTRYTCSTWRSACQFTNQPRGDQGLQERYSAFAPIKVHFLLLRLSVLKNVHRNFLRFSISLKLDKKLINNASSLYCSDLW
jgi:hypothetical protein